MRAPRFPLQLAVAYRAVGQLEWQHAKTANVSSSGVLVRTPHAPEVNTALEFRLVLALRDEERTRSEVSGRGHVVRQIAPPEQGTFGFAIAIDQYDFSPNSQPQHA